MLANPKEPTTAGNQKIGDLAGLRTGRDIINAAESLVWRIEHVGAQQLIGTER
jgi:hypothetical protein